MAYPRTNPSAPKSFYPKPATMVTSHNPSGSPISPNDGTGPAAGGAGAGTLRLVRIGEAGRVIGFV